MTTAAPTPSPSPFYAGITAVPPVAADPAAAPVAEPPAKAKRHPVRSPFPRNVEVDIKAGSTWHGRLYSNAEVHCTVVGEPYDSTVMPRNGKVVDGLTCRRVTVKHTDRTVSPLVSSFLTDHALDAVQPADLQTWPVATPAAANDSAAPSAPVAAPAPIETYGVAVGQIRYGGGDPELSRVEVMRERGDEFTILYSGGARASLPAADIAAQWPTVAAPASPVVQGQRRSGGRAGADLETVTVGACTSSGQHGLFRMRDLDGEGRIPAYLTAAEILRRWPTVVSTPQAAPLVARAAGEADPWNSLRDATSAGKHEATAPATHGVEVGQIRGSVDGCKDPATCGDIVRVEIRRDAGGRYLAVPVWPSVVRSDGWAAGIYVKADDIERMWPCIEHAASHRCTVQKPTIHGGAVLPVMAADPVAKVASTEEAPVAMAAATHANTGTCSEEIRSAILAALRNCPLGRTMVSVAQIIGTRFNLDPVIVIMDADDLIGRGEIHARLIQGFTCWIAGPAPVESAPIVAPPAPIAAAADPNAVALDQWAVRRVDGLARLFVDDLKNRLGLTVETPTRAAVVGLILSRHTGALLP